MGPSAGDTAASNQNKYLFDQRSFSKRRNGERKKLGHKGRKKTQRNNEGWGVRKERRKKKDWVKK